MLSYKYIILAAIFLHCVACVAFFFGFLPMNQTSKKNNSRTQLKSVPAKYTHLIVMVIDALRVDFVFNAERVPSRMPFLQEKIFTNKTYSFKAQTKPPTVTMPRIKAFTSGAISGFGEIILNAASVEFTEDNIITSLLHDGFNMTFYGDDTWLKLFPNQFLRSDGTKSFFVTDFTEVDDNVTRHLADEYELTDWNVMILHYLGLDHIGHLDGPSSRYVDPKLREMDEVIRSLYNSMVDRDNRFGSKTLLLICGDHGMSDAGSHGGASLQEIYTPAIFIDTLAGTYFNGEDRIQQIDLAATISILFGLHLPSTSVGRPIPTFYKLYEKNEQLRIQQLTACQLSFLAESQIGNSLFKELNDVCAGEAKFSQADIILSKVCMELQNAVTGYNSKLMVLGISLAFTATLIMSYVLVLIWYQKNKRNITKPSVVGSVNMSIMYDAFCVVISLLSIISTSLIEEEHYIWYYFTTTYFIYLFICNMKKTNTLYFTLLLLSFRLARLWNHTGVKWLQIEDLKTWFNKNDRVVELMVITFTLCFLVFLIYINEEKNIVTRLIFFFTFCLLMLYRILPSLGIDTLITINLSRLIYLLILVMISLFKYSYVKYTRTICLILCMLLLRTENLPWFCMIVIIERIVWTKAFPGLFVHLLESEWRLIWLVFMLSKFTFFSQGNSNNLSTIDVSAGMIGFQEYHPVFASIITFLATYCGQIFWSASLIDLAAKYRVSAGLHLKMIAITTMYQVLHAGIFFLLLFLQRYHLFIWSVFAPKFLYVVANTFFILSISTIGLIKMETQRL